MAQPVDPFIPVSPRTMHFKKRPLPRPARRVGTGKFNADILPPARQHASPVRHLPNKITADTRHYSATNSITHTARPRQQEHIRVQQDAPQPRERRWFYYVKLLAACIGMLAVGSLAQVAVAGEVLISVYAVWALVKRTPSRTTFLLALGTFAAILLVLLIKPDQILMKNFATYAFLFLLVGAISLAREARD